MEDQREVLWDDLVAEAQVHWLTGRHISVRVRVNDPDWEFTQAQLNEHLKCFDLDIRLARELRDALTDALDKAERGEGW